MSEITIILADAQYLIRIGLRKLISGIAQFSILGEAKNQTELLSLLEHHKPQVVILDYNQDKNFNQSIIPTIKSIAPSCNILVISADNNKNNIYEVLENGVNSFLTKQCDKSEIVDAIHATAKGEKFFCSKVIDFIFEKSFAPNAQNCAPTPLSPREVEIVGFIAQGLIAKEIAGELNLSTHTIYTHRKNIMRKLQLNSTSELVIYAINHGMVDQTISR